MNATSSLVAKTAAAAAADFVVEHDRAAPPRSARCSPRPRSARPTRRRSARSSRYLHARIYGELVAPDSPEVDETYALYQRRVRRDAATAAARGS